VKGLIELSPSRARFFSFHRFQEKDYLAVVRGAPSRASLRQQPAGEGAPRTISNIFLNATEKILRSPAPQYSLPIAIIHYLDKKPDSADRKL
jgi:hypothetical protein